MLARRTGVPALCGRYFKDGAFPDNLRAIWESRFAYLPTWQGGKTPVVVGELGGWYTGKDKQWQDWAVRYMADKGIGLFYFVLQPTSDDTGGLLKSDWESEEVEKLAMLNVLPSTSVGPLVGLTEEGGTGG